MLYLKYLKFNTKRMYKFNMRRIVAPENKIDQRLVGDGGFPEIKVEPFLLIELLL